MYKTLIPIAIEQLRTNNFKGCVTFKAGNKGDELHFVFNMIHEDGKVQYQLDHSHELSYSLISKILSYGRLEYDMSLLKLLCGDDYEYLPENRRAKETYSTSGDILDIMTRYIDDDSRFITKFDNGCGYTEVSTSNGNDMLGKITSTDGFIHDKAIFRIEEFNKQCISQAHADVGIEEFINEYRFSVYDCTNKTKNNSINRLCCIMDLKTLKKDED